MISFFLARGGFVPVVRDTSHRRPRKTRVYYVGRSHPLALQLFLAFAAQEDCSDEQWKADIIVEACYVRLISGGFAYACLLEDYGPWLDY